MTDKLKLRTEDQPCTQKLFDRLPALLTAHQVKWVTSLSDHELAEEVRTGRLKTYERAVKPGRKRAYKKYTKASVAKLVGFEI